MGYDPSKEIELNNEVFRKLKNVKVVFDVGARVDVDYIDIHPKAEFHLFEPNPVFFKELTDSVGQKPNVHLNNFGLSDTEGILHYDNGTQSFMKIDGELELPVKTLDWYCCKHGIEQIDFLKIDTEGWDYRVLQGGSHTIKKCRYIQYEHWDRPHILDFHDLLENDFIMCYIGYRNVFCIRKGEKWW